MAFLGGLFRRGQRQDESPPPLPPMPAQVNSRSILDLTDPDQLCQYVITLQANLRRVESLCDKANKEVEDYRNQIRDLKFQNANLQSKMTARAREIGHISGLRKEEQIEARNTRTALDLEKLNRIDRTRDALYYEEQMVSGILKLRSLEKQDDALVSAEKTLEERAMLPPQPFVVVLVDGDGYRFETTAKTEGIEMAGVTIAQRLNLAVSRQILMNEHIPPSSKIVVRVFFNGRARHGERVRSGMDYSPHQMMMIKFQETKPLFDYIDCGSGKERADVKIHENAHLYIADPSCHAVFLAVCHDNGFARLLEQYQANPIAQAKIFLVDAGVVVSEIARLRGFTRITLDGVFQDMYWLRNDSRGGSQTGSQARKMLYPTAPPFQSRPTELVFEGPGPTCRFASKCKNRKCKFSHPVVKGAMVPTGPRTSSSTTAPTTAPTTHYMDMSAKSPTMLMLEAEIYETTQYGKSGASGKVEGNIDPKSQPTSKSQSTSSYLEFVGVHHPLPARAHGDPYLVPFPRLWDKETDWASTPNEESERRIVEVDLD